MNLICIRYIYIYSLNSIIIFLEWNHNHDNVNKYAWDVSYITVLYCQYFTLQLGPDRLSHRPLPLEGDVQSMPLRFCLKQRFPAVSCSFLVFKAIKKEGIIYTQFFHHGLSFLMFEKNSWSSCCCFQKQFGPLRFLHSDSGGSIVWSPICRSILMSKNPKSTTLVVSIFFSKSKNSVKTS